MVVVCFNSVWLSYVSIVYGCRMVFLKNIFLEIREIFYKNPQTFISVTDGHEEHMNISLFWWIHDYFLVHRAKPPQVYGNFDSILYID